MNRRRFASRTLGALAFGRLGWLFPRCTAGEAALPQKASGAALDWQPMVEFDGHLFASLLLATESQSFPDGANSDDTVFGDPNGLAAAVVRAPHANTRVKVRAEGGKFWQGGALECVLPAAGQRYWIAPRLHYSYDAVRTMGAAEACEVRIGLEIDGASVGEKTVTATVHPVRECVYGVKESAGFPDKYGRGLMLGYGWMFAAYIDETHPFATHLIDDALATGAVREFDGYRSGDGDQVLLQVYAIWEALARRGVHYRRYMRTTAVSPLVLSQPIRSLGEMAAKPSGTEAEGVVLFASALLRAGLRPFVAIIEEHIEIAVDRSDGNGNLAGLDLLFMGATDAPETLWAARLRDSLPETLKRAPSLGTFGKALADGTEDVLNYAQQFELTDPRWQLIDVRQARIDGIQPLARS